MRILRTHYNGTNLGHGNIYELRWSIYELSDLLVFIKTHCECALKTLFEKNQAKILDLV